VPPCAFFNGFAEVLRGRHAETASRRFCVTPLLKGPWIEHAEIRSENILKYRAGYPCGHFSIIPLALQYRIVTILIVYLSQISLSRTAFYSTIKIIIRSIGSQAFRNFWPTA
jgi:hypothetical protein